MRDEFKRLAAWRVDILGEQFSVVYCVYILVVAGFLMADAWWGIGLL